MFSIRQTLESGLNQTPRAVGIRAHDHELSMVQSAHRGRREAYLFQAYARQSAPSSLVGDFRATDRAKLPSFM